MRIRWLTKRGLAPSSFPVGGVSPLAANVDAIGQEKKLFSDSATVSVTASGEFNTMVALSDSATVSVAGAGTVEALNYIDLPLRVDTYAEALLTIPLQVDTDNQSKTLQIPLTVETFKEQLVTLPMSVSVLQLYDAAGSPVSDPPNAWEPNMGAVGSPYLPADNTGEWTAIVIINGQDFSPVVKGQIVVNREVNQAAIATINLSGIELSPTQASSFKNKWVTISFKPSGWAIRLFTGKVKSVTHVNQDDTYSLHCTDRLQEVVNSLNVESTVNTVAGTPIYSENLTQVDETNWDVLSNFTPAFQADYGLDIAGSNFIHSPWESGSNVHYFTNDNVMEGSVSVSLQDADNIVNRVVVDVEYVKSKCDFYNTVVRWSHPGGGHKGMESYPTAQMVVDAINSAGFKIRNVHYFGKSPLNVANNGLIQSFMVGAQARSIRSETDKYQIVVVDYTSQVRNGTKQENSSGSMSAAYAPYLSYWTEEVQRSINTVINSGVRKQLNYAAYMSGTEAYNKAPKYPDTLDWQEYVDLRRARNAIGGMSSSYPPVEDQLVFSGTRASDFASYKNYLTALAKTRILSSHRANVVQLTTTILPTLWWGQTLSVNVRKLTAVGKSRAVTHILDIDTGSATTTVDISVHTSSVDYSASVTPVTQGPVANPPFIVSAGTIATGACAPSSEDYYGTYHDGDTSDESRLGAVGDGQGLASIFRVRLPADLSQIGRTCQPTLDILSPIVNEYYSYHSVSLPEGNLIIG